MQQLAQALTLPGQSDANVINTVITGPSNFTFRTEASRTLGSVLSAAIPFIFAFAGIALLVMLILGGFALLTSAGDSKKLDSGKRQITYAIVGFLVIFISFWIVQLIGRIFNLTVIMDVFGGR